MFKLPISTRRDLLTRGLGLIGVGAELPNFLIRTALAGPKASADQNILVVFQFSGGNDGLSMVVPFGDDEYGRSRKSTRHDAKDLHKLSDYVGLNPNLTGLKQMYDQGRLAVIQGVGYPNPNRSHFHSMDIWHTAGASGSKLPYEGWLGRWADRSYQGVSDPKICTAVRMEKTPLAVRGKDHPGIAFASTSSFKYYADRGDKERNMLYRELNEAGGEAMKNNTLDFVTHTAANANQASDEIQRIAGKYNAQAQYPQSGISESLKTVAALIRGGLSTRVYYVATGSFDTHSGQKQRHDKLMTDVNGAVTAFYKDLAAQGLDKRVLTMSFSEFGRRVKENGSQGTDHGCAGPMFLYGPGVKPGLHGKYPSLTDLDKGDLKFNVDFRSVYAAVLDRWLGTSSESVLGGSFAPLDCVI